MSICGYKEVDCFHEVYRGLKKEVGEGNVYKVCLLYDDGVKNVGFDV